jgi:hypothetical protein
MLKFIRFKQEDYVWHQNICYILVICTDGKYQQLQIFDLDTRKMQRFSYRFFELNRSQDIHVEEDGSMLTTCILSYAEQRHFVHKFAMR